MIPRDSTTSPTGYYSGGAKPHFPTKSSSLTKRQNKIFFIILHLAAGAFLERRDLLVTVWPLVVLSFGCIRVEQTKNRYGAAHNFAAYLMGLEVFLRMNR